MKSHETTKLLIKDNIEKMKVAQLRRENRSQEISGYAEGALHTVLHGFFGFHSS